MAYNITRTQQTSTAKKLAYLVVIIICFIIIHNLATSIYDLWNKQDVVTSAQSQLVQEKSENQKLKAQLKVVGNDEFLQTEARNELFMVKPGESGVILPQDLGLPSKQKSGENLPNWQKWFKAFGF